MHAADLQNSDRLQRVLAFLQDGAPHSTLEIVQGARVVAVNSCIAELRVAGYTISCRQATDPITGNRIWLYQLSGGPAQ